MGNSQQPRIILNHILGSADKILFDRNARDNCCDPYIKLQEKCRELGYRFEGTASQPVEACRWILVWDAWTIAPKSPLRRLLFNLSNRRKGGSPRDIVAEAQAAGLSDRLVLVMFEPPSACPENFDPAVHRQFAKIFTWDPELVDGRKFHQIYLPSPATFPPLKPVPFADRKLLIDISGYHFVGHARELYTERRNVTRFFQKHFPGDFDLYGAGWNPTIPAFLKRWIANPRVRYEHFSAWRGPVRNKAEVYPKYRFGMCYENILDQPGYVSLKIFDCIRSGVVPIYLGAPDIDKYVDREAFVDRRQFGSLEELAQYLFSVDEKRFNAYIEAGQAHLRGPKFQLFQPAHFTDSITGPLGLDH